ncbi:MAG: FecR domain-containing protein [Mucilaginibacter polytrichastri]|nr:FecR domain-containing protein [Mucilaginibacter polytrichastri]
MPQNIPLTLQALLDDDEFVHAARQPAHHPRPYLAKLREDHPGSEALINEAVVFVATYRHQAVFTHENRRQAVWDRIESTIDSASASRRRVFGFIRIAAALFLFLSVALLFWQYRQTISVETAFGEIRAVELPDHSRITLNGNSSLRYARNWDKTGVREVWIDGEGLFEVKHLNRDTAHITDTQRFIVHAKDIDIEVLGTTFNVRERNGKTNVQLLSGKIRIDDHQAETKAGLTMKPGEAVSYKKKELVKRRFSADPAAAIAWTQKRLAFEDASLGEIIETLENAYGYTVKISDEKLRNERIEGTINVNHVPELIETLESALHLRITLKQKSITITPN